MVLSKEAEEAKPKKPLNLYMRFRQGKLQEHKDNPEKNTLVKR